jgi:hypothetical protein
MDRSTRCAALVNRSFTINQKLQLSCSWRIGFRCWEGITHPGNCLRIQARSVDDCRALQSNIRSYWRALRILQLVGVGYIDRYAVRSEIATSDCAVDRKRRPSSFCIGLKGKTYDACFLKSFVTRCGCSITAVIVLRHIEDKKKMTSESFQSLCSLQGGQLD